MKDIIISSKQLKKELRIIAICFIVAFLINIAAVIKYKTPWTEIFSQIGYVIVITFILYFVVVLVRLLVRLILKLFKKSNS